MVADTKLIDERVSIKQCKLAIETLHAHETKKEQELSEGELLPRKDPNVWLNVTVKQMPSSYKIKPAKIPIVHPLIDPRTTPICLITKDPQREYKDLLEQKNIKFISRVVGVAKLKGKFKPFEARRRLLKEYGLFLADERVIPLLPKLLGVKWFEAKKQPIPVCLTRKDLKGELERAVSSTYLNQNKGTCTSIKIGVLSQKPSHILANLEKALPVVANHIQGGWDNIQALHIKTNSSVSLPIWACVLDGGEGGRWNGIPSAVDEAAGGSVDESSGGEVDEVPVVSAKKGKKRAQDDDGATVPKKKAKSDSIVESSDSTAKQVKAKSKAGSQAVGSSSESVAVKIPRAKESKNADKNVGKMKAQSKASSGASEKGKPQLASRGDKEESILLESTKNTKSKPSLTAEEVKLKRSVGPGERKKNKTTSTSSKSVKNALLGRKTGKGV